MPIVEYRGPRLPSLALRVARDDTSQMKAATEPPTRTPHGLQGCESVLHADFHSPPLILAYFCRIGANLHRRSIASGGDSAYISIRDHDYRDLPHLRDTGWKTVERGKQREVVRCDCRVKGSCRAACWRRRTFPRVTNTASSATSIATPMTRAPKSIFWQAPLPAALSRIIPSKKRACCSWARSESARRTWPSASSRT